MIKAVIFDMDGTLIDSVDLHARAWQEIFHQHGLDTEYQAVRDQIGKGGDKLMEVFLSPEQIEREGKQIEQERLKLFKRKYMPKVRPFPRLEDLFERLRADGIRIALGSSAKEDELRRYREITGIGPYLDAATSSDQVSNSKPDPDIFQAARKKLGVDASEILAVGDSPYDAESAGKAGIATIGLLCGGFPEEKLLAAGCVALYRDPADLLANYSRSRFGQGRTITAGAGKRSIYFLLGLTVGFIESALSAPNAGPPSRKYSEGRTTSSSTEVPLCRNSWTNLERS